MRGRCKWGGRYGKCRRSPVVKKYFQDGRLVEIKELGMCNEHRVRMREYARRLRVR